MLFVVLASPAESAGCDWLGPPAVSQVETGDETLVKTKVKIISHRARNPARNTDQSKRAYSLVHMFVVDQGDGKRSKS